MTESQARSLNKNDPANDNYSILDEMESFRHGDGKFTLKLEWPYRLGQNSQTWRQTTNPLLSTGGGVVGYEVCGCPRQRVYSALVIFHVFLQCHAFFNLFLHRDLCRLWT